jgi:hypothetical protein
MSLQDKDPVQRKSATFGLAPGIDLEYAPGIASCNMTNREPFGSLFFIKNAQTAD